MCADESKWWVYKNKTCYRIDEENMTVYSPKTFYKVNGYKILSLSEYFNKVGHKEKTVDDYRDEFGTKMMYLINEYKELGVSINGTINVNDIHEDGLDYSRYPPVSIQKRFKYNINIDF